MSNEIFAQNAALGIVKGLYQELQIVPRRHYVLKLDDASRVVVICLHRINPRYLSKISGMANELSMFAGLDEKRKIRIGWRGRNILLEVPKPPPLWKKVTIERLEHHHYIRKGIVATIGLGLQDDPKRVDFRRPDMAHLFITGQTRSGKTNTQRLIAWNLAHNTTPDDAQMIIFDVAKRGYQWSDFSRVASLAHPLVTDLAEADKVLSWASLELDRRGEGRRTTPKVFLLIDELKALIDDSKVAASYLARIASLGGEFGLHLVLSTQYPQAGMMGSSELKRNVTTRLCGKVDDSHAAHNALGVGGSGAEWLQGYGDFLLKNGEGLSRLTVAKIEPAHVAMLPRRESIQPLDLPDQDLVNNGPPPQRQPDPVEPAHVALALFEPMGINKLARELSIGSTKAKRVKDFANTIRQWAIDNAPAPDRPIYNFLDSNWVVGDALRGKCD